MEPRTSGPARVDDASPPALTHMPLDGAVRTGPLERGASQASLDLRFRSVWVPGAHVLHIPRSDRSDARIPVDQPSFPK